MDYFEVDSSKGEHMELTVTFKVTSTMAALTMARAIGDVIQNPNDSFAQGYLAESLNGLPMIEVHIEGEREGIIPLCRRSTPY